MLAVPCFPGGSFVVFVIHMRNATGQLLVLRSYLVFRMY